MCHSECHIYHGHANCHYAECRYAVYPYTACRYADCLYAAYCYTEGRYAEFGYAVYRYAYSLVTTIIYSR
jgi:hypothetical protein